MTMKYMIMMFGEAAGMMETEPPAWIREMIGFMVQIDKDLRDSGELVFQAGLTDGSTAKLVRLENGIPVATDGPFAESKEFLAGYWIVEVDRTERAYELAAKASAAPGRGGVPLNMPIEVRQVMSGPPTDA